MAQQFMMCNESINEKGQGYENGLDAPILWWVSHWHPLNASICS